MHLIDEHPPEPRSKHGMDLIAVQAPLPPSEDALLRDCSVTVIVAGAGLGSLQCGRGCGSRATWRYSLSTARGGGQQLAQREYGPETAFYACAVVPHGSKSRSTELCRRLFVI